MHVKKTTFMLLLAAVIVPLVMGQACLPTPGAATDIGVLDTDDSVDDAQDTVDDATTDQALYPWSLSAWWRQMFTWLGQN